MMREKHSNVQKDVGRPSSLVTWELLHTWSLSGNLLWICGGPDWWGGSGKEISMHLCPLTHSRVIAVIFMHCFQSIHLSLIWALLEDFLGPIQIERQLWYHGTIAGLYCCGKWGVPWRLYASTWIPSDLLDFLVNFWTYTILEHQTAYLFQIRLNYSYQSSTGIEV